MQRRGWRTSEFWAALAVGAGSLAASLSGYLSPHWAALASAISLGLYALGRGLAKGGTGAALGELARAVLVALEQQQTAPAGPQAAAPSGVETREPFVAVTAPPEGAE